MAQTPWTGLLTGSSTPLLASGDVIAFVDVSDTTQSPQGSLVKGTLTQYFAAIPVPVNITSASAVSLAVGRLGSTTPAFTVDSSTASQVAGLKVTGAATGGTVAVVVTDSGSDANLTVNAKGTGTIGIGSVSTGRVTITPVTTITGALTLSAALTYGGVTLSNSVTGTGSMVLSASPTFTGTLAAASATLAGTLTITSASATALTVGPSGATNPTLLVDASNASSATGITIVANAAASGVGIAAISSGTNENLRLDAKGSGTITLGSSSTGAITLTRATTLSAALTYGGVTLSNAVTGTGNMVLSASPTLTGTALVAALTASGLITGSAGVTVASGQTLTLTGATVSGTPTWSSSQAITLSTAAQPNVTSLGTLTGLTMGGTLTMGANTLALASATVSGQPTWSSAQAITLSTAAQPNVTSVGTLTSVTVSGTSSLGDVVTLTNASNLRWGTTSSFPMLVRSSGNLVVKLADDSAFTNFTAEVLGARGQVEIGTSAVASSGVIRMSNNTALGWRNNADSGDVTLTKNASDIFAFSSGISATTGTFSGDVTLTGAGSDVIVAATAKYRLDGSASGDTYISEASANEIIFIAGNATVATMSATALILDAAVPIELQFGRTAAVAAGVASTHKIQVKDGAGNTYYLLATNV